MQAFMAIEEDATHGATCIIPANNEEAAGIRELFFAGVAEQYIFTHHEAFLVGFCDRAPYGKSGGKRRSSFFVCQ